MPGSEEEVRTFVARYARALSEGDLSTIVDCWGVPAAVLYDEGIRVVSSADETREFFGASVGWYHAQGLMSTTPDTIQIEPLSERLTEADVVWAARDAQNEIKATERTRYVLHSGDDGQLRILVSIKRPTEV